MARNELENRTKKFALAVIDLVERMPRNRAGDVVGRQLLRSGTSIEANFREANRAESRNDFILKVGLSSKEASETEFCVSESPHLQTSGSTETLQESRELLAIFTTIGKKAKSVNS